MTIVCFAGRNKQMTVARRATGSEFNKGSFGGTAPDIGLFGSAPTPFFVAAVDEGASSPSLISQAFAQGTWL
jgi:hypothetical protein